MNETFLGTILLMYMGILCVVLVLSLFKDLRQNQDADNDDQKP